MTQRTQITLDPEQHRKVRRRASALGISMAQYLREIIERELSDTPARGDVSAILALGNSGDSDVARHKDEYVRAAVEEIRPRRAASL